MAAFSGDNGGASSDLGLDESCILQVHSRVYPLLLCRILLEPCGLIANSGGEEVLGLQSTSRARRLSHGSQKELETIDASQERLGLAGDADSNEEGRMDEECSLIQIRIAKPACYHLSRLLPQF